MSYRHIEVERRGEIEIIRLNRPRYRNAQSRILLEEMTQAFARADLDNDVKVIVLAAAGDHFSAGHDLGTPEELEEDRKTNPSNRRRRSRAREPLVAPVRGKLAALARCPQAHHRPGSGLPASSAAS